MCGFSSDAYRDLPRMLAITESGQTAGITCGCGREEERGGERSEGKGEGKEGRGGKEKGGGEGERNRTEREKVREGNWTGEGQKESGNKRESCLPPYL